MENSSQPRKKWGEARREFKPLVPDIQKYLEQEYSKKEIYYTLYEQKKIEMSYFHFCRLIQEKLGVKKRNVNKKSQPRTNIEKALKNNNAPARVEHKAVANRTVQTMPAVYGSDEDESFGKKQFDPDELI